VKPATKRLDWSFAPIPEFDERFARQYRDDLPPNFHLALIYSSIARRFSGLSIACSNSEGSALGLTLLGDQGKRPIQPIYWFLTSFRLWASRAFRLACTLNSLVRVTRRARHRLSPPILSPN